MCQSLDAADPLFKGVSEKERQWLFPRHLFTMGKLVVSQLERN